MKKFILLLMMVLTFAIFTATVSGATHQYVGPKKCKMCHRIEFKSWNATPHAKATEVLPKDKKNDPKCLECHATTKDIPEVTCEACHGPGKDYKKGSVMRKRDLAIKKGLVIPDEKTCLKCHDSKKCKHVKGFDYKKMFKDGVHQFKHKK